MAANRSEFGFLSTTGIGLGSSPFRYHLYNIFVSASRLGRWTGSLCAQQLAQSCVQPEERSMFAGTEASLASTFGLGHWIATVIWSKRQEFHWIALSSLLVTVCSTGLYAFWLLGRGKRLVS